MSLAIPMAAGQELRSTNRPLYGASAVTLNDTLYIYGGFYNEAPWNKEALWKLPNTINKLSQLDTDPYSSPAVIYHSLRAIDNRTLYSFGGHLENKAITNSSIANTVELLRYYRFDLDTLKWTPLQKKNATSPLERFWHSTAQYNSLIYLLGGMNVTSGAAFNDFWKYNTVNDSWTELSPLPKSRCGHTSTVTNDGKIIILGGFDCTNASLISPQDKILYSLNTAFILDTITGRWYDQPLKGAIIPDPRTFHTAVKTQKEDWIIICGGQDHNKEPFQTYLSGGNDLSQMTAILNLQTWEWTIPPVSPYQPFPRSFAVASIVNETKMVYGFGLNYHTVYDGIYVFDTEANKWESPMSSIESQGGLSRIGGGNAIPGAMVVIITILAFLLSLLMVAYWFMARRRATFFSFFRGIRKSVWNPRAGEPLWAEVSRLLFRFLILSVFIIIGTVLALQVQNSPVIGQVYHNYQDDILAPDIRFCFDGWDHQPSPILQCSTDFGESCNQCVQNITTTVKDNLNYYGKKLTCYLFTLNNSIKLAKNRSSGNGSSISFHYYGQTSNDSIIHVEFYHPFHDPNIPVYGLVGGQFDRWYNVDENAEFQANEQENLKSENVYNLDPTTKSQIGYEFTETQKMGMTAWNYLGFGTKRDTIHQIQTTLSTATNNDNTTLGSLQVFPTSYHIKVIREERAFTVIHGMGMIGGILGLMIGFQAALFGYRPRSPWGIVHRCSVSLMRKSLLNGLKSRFSSSKIDVPIVHPVHKRYLDSHVHEEEEQDESQRMIKLEERLHIFELLFQAYYIDDEVFRSLDNSSRLTGL